MNDLLKLENEIKNRLSGYRLNHVLSVRTECEKLAALFELSEKECRELQISAYLHDITKELSTDQQLMLAKELSLSLTEDDLDSPVILHALTGSALASRDFSDFANSKVCDAIACHTTGKENMSIMEKLLFLADYIEPLRTFEDCQKVRDYFYQAIQPCQTLQEKILHLNETLLYAFDLTICELIDEKSKIHPNTIKSRNFLL
jgi:predicted HD superfamily hydrolase involved in NAD metabolism